MSDRDSRYGRAAARFDGNIFGQRGGMAVAVAASIAVWIAVFHGVPALSGMSDLGARLVFALNCICVAVLLCFLTGVEAIAHERLFSAAFDPLAGRESMRLKINARYLHNTLEQIVLFATGLLGLAASSADGHAMRAVAATTVVWVLARFVFWIGYHHGPQYRVFGLAGMMQSMLVLLYVCARFGYGLAGIVGAAIPLVMFGAIELYLVMVMRRPAA